MPNTCPRWTRRASHHPYPGPPARRRRPAPAATLTVRLGQVAAIRDLLTVVLADLTGKDGAR